MLTGFKLHLWHGNVNLAKQKKWKGYGGCIELNFVGLVMQKWNVPPDRVQNVDKKTGVICKTIMFIFTVIVTKMPKIAHSLLMTAKD